MINGTTSWRFLESLTDRELLTDSRFADPWRLNITRHAKPHA
jgi:hypothetical protein